MISYDRYKEKIAKLAAVKNFVVRFRALFIAAFALIVALISAFLVTKGMVTSDFSLSQADILYGDVYEIKPAKALFSSVRYEFAPENSEDWSEEQPDKAGKYRVRTVTDKAFGTGYGKPLSFEIAPRPTEIEIKQENVVYGDDPSNFTCTLVNGDTLSVVGFSFDSFATDITSVCANAESVVITNAAGEDVTYCYTLSTPVKQVKLDPKRVSFAPKAAEYIYNGAPLSYESVLDEASQKQLAAGDVITVTSEITAQGGEVVASPKNAGTYTVKITDIKIMNGDTDVTALYDWESGLKTAKLTVARRAITVQTASDTKEYDATPLINASFTAENLAEGHTFIVEESASRINVGNSFNEITAYKIQAGGDEEVTDNYTVKFNAGTLVITPREIIIKTSSAEKAYDGKPLSNALFTMNPMPVEGHDFAVSRELPEITEVGTIQNTLTVSATDEEGNPVTGNYTVGYDYGDLVIKEQQLKYTAETITRVYDGTALLSAGTVTDGLAEGEYVEIDIEASAKQTLAGDTDNAPVFRVYRIEDGRETTHNYTPALQGERGKLVVQKRRVVVHTLTPDEEFEYDGGDHVWPLADVFLEGTEEYGLANGQRYEALIGADGTIRIVESKPNKFEVEFYEGDTEVTENYEVVKYEYGTLTVYKRTLHIATGTKVDVEYDGKPFTFTEGWSADRLADGHTLKADTTKTIASVTEVLEQPLINEVTYLVFDGEGNDVTQNYDIQPYAYGVINRTPRLVTLATKSASTPYDGNPMQCLEWEKVERLLTEYKHQIALDETLEEYFASITYGYDEYGNQLSEQNILYFVVLDGEGKDISYNYALDVSYGTLTRSKCAMTVHTLSATKVYDGYFLYGDDEGEFMTVKPVFDGLVEGELYETSSCTTVLNVKYEERDAVAVKNDTVYDYYTSDRSFKTTHNYDVTTVMGALLITPRPLSIRTSTVTKVYDGQWLYGTAQGEGENGATVITGFADGQSAAVIESSVPKIRDVLWAEKDGKQTIDAIENTTQYKVIVTETGEDTTDNYYIAKRENGKLTITPKALTATTLSASKIYDAEPLDGSAEGAWENGKPVFSGLVVGETYKADTVFTMTDVRRGENGEDVLTRDNTTTYAFYAQEDGAERETTGNYTVEYVCGTLKILPREITVTTVGATKTYDGTPLTKRKAGDYFADNLVSTEKHVHTLALDTSRESEFGTVTDVMDSPQKNELYVLVKEGEKDVTSNYHIIGYVYGDLVVTPRDITVTTASDTKAYDGTPLVKEDGFKPSWLFTGHKLVLDESRRSEFGSVVNVAEGEVDNVLYFKVQLEGGTEEQHARVNANYNILPPENWGKLKITPKTITVRTADKNWTYDGKEHEWHEKSCDEQDFLDSVIGDTKGKHVLVADTSRAFGKITNVWENKANNNVQYYFVYPENYDENGTEDNAFINQNYKIEYVYGNLVIDKRAVTITTITAEKTYDGSPLKGDVGYGENTEITIGGLGLADGEKAKSITDTVVTIGDVIIQNNETKSQTNTTRYDIWKGDTITTRNYQITWIDGELKINKRKITITTLTAEKIYDGTALDGSGKNFNASVTVHQQFTIGGSGLGGRDKCEAVDPIGIVNVEWKNGEVDCISNTTYYRIRNSSGNDVTEQNYEVERIYGTLKILPREIKYTTPTATHEYDGKEFFKHDTGYKVDFVKGETVVAEGKGLALDNHKLVPVTDMANPYSTITNVLVKDGEVASIENVVYYRVVDDNGDVTANYNITGRSWGTLTVTRRLLQITTNDHTWVYADEDFEDGGYTAKHLVKDGDTATDDAFTLVSGHTLKSVSVKKVHDVCTDTPNVCTYKVMKGTDDVSDNYKLTIVEGKLTVSKRPITVTSGSETWVYDGQAHNKLDDFDWTKLGTDVGLLSEHGHEVFVATAEADAPKITHFSENKEKNNVLTFAIMKGVKDVTANYDVTTEYGTIAIKKAEITVVLTPFEPVKYNGAAVTYPTGENNYVVDKSTSLQNNEKLEVAVYFTLEKTGTGEKVTPIRKGTYYAHLDYDNCKVSSGSTETDASDYEITAQPVELVIEQKELTVATQSGSREYDGEAYTLPVFTAETIAALPAGHTIEVDNDKPIASVTEVDVNGDKVKNVFSYIIRDEKKADVTEDFFIKEKWGEIFVTARTVKVVTASGTHEYDGNAFSYPNWENDPDGLLANKGHKLEWDESKATASVLTVSEKEKTNTFSVVVKDASGKDISYNYDIQYQADGKIKITPRQIEVVVNSAEKDYDGSKLVEKGAKAYHLSNDVRDGKDALLGDDELVVDSESPEVFIINAYDEGTGINVYSYLIKNGANNVSENYKIVKTIAGDLIINPLAVKVTLKPLADTVYGDPVSPYDTGTGNYASLSPSLARDEMLEVAVYFTLDGEQTERGKAGTYNIVLDQDNCKIHKGTEVVERGIENYTLTQEAATVTVDKREVELTIKQLTDASKEYDGDTFDYVTAFGANQVCYTAITLNTQNGVFAEGETLNIALTVIGENAAHTSLLHADKYTVSIDLSSCTVKNGDDDLSDNYTLTAADATASYEIIKRALTVKLRGDTREYDGTVYSYAFKQAGEEGYEIAGLLDDTTLSGNFVFTGDELPPKNVGTYTVTFQTEDGTWTISSSRTEPCETSDYTIKNVKDATLEIQKRKITVAIVNWDEDYTAKDFLFANTEYDDEKKHYTSSHVGFEGESGFVNGDEVGAYDFVFERGGDEVTPRNVGVYNVTLSFNASLSENYDITSNVGGTFTVNKRAITVVGGHNDFTYAARVMNAEDGKFFFTSHQKDNVDGEGFLGEDASAFTATYTVKYDGTIFNHATEIIHGGQYTVVADLTVKPEQSEIRDNYIISYEAGEFTVDPRKIYATRDEAFTKTYDKVEISTDGWNFFDWFVDENGEAENRRPTTANGFLLSDRTNAKPIFEIYGDGEGAISPINAGTYTIRISGFTSANNNGLIERDYIVGGGEETLTIEKFLLIIKPKDYTGLNTGKDIALPEDSVITYTANAAGNGVVTCSLPEGDSVTITGDAVLKPGSKYVQAVYIASYTLHGGDGVANNYRVIYKYDTKDVDDAELLKKLGAGMKAFFRGNITCDTRTVEIRQILKNDKHKSIVTNGSKYNIPLTDDDVGFELLTFGNKSPSLNVEKEKYGLLDGHYARATAASVRQYPGIYKEWLTVKIYCMEDGKEIDVTKGYNIVIQDDESSYIEVKAVSLAFDILADMGALVNSGGNKPENGDVVYLKNEGSNTPLKPDEHFKLTEGELFGKHQVEFKAVVEDGVLVGLKPSVYTEHSSGMHISQETYYDVGGALFKYTIYLTADSAEKQFDGKALTCKTATASWLPKDYTFTVKIETARTTAGTSDNSILTGSAKIFDQNGDEASVVSIVCGNGKLTVKQRPLIVKSTPSKTFTYNGTAQSFTEGFVVEGLVDGHSITSVKGTEVTLPTGSGVKNVPTILEIKSTINTTNYASSYKIICDDEHTNFGYLNVLRRDVNVSIVGSTFTKEYDGRPLTLDISVASGTNEGVLTALGHKLEWSAVSIIRPSESQEVSFGSDMLRISGKDGDVTQYYNIQVVGGVTSVQLTVTPLKLEVTSNDLTKPYDGTALVGTASLTDGALVIGDKLTFTGSASIKDVGSTPYQLGCKIVGSDGVDITEDCYEVSYVSGTLQISKKAITVTSIDIGSVVYGEALEAPTGAGNYAGLSASLASGERLEVSYYYTSDAAGLNVVTPKNAGTYYVWTENYTVYGGKAGNYEFSCTPSTVQIEQKKLEVKLRQGLTKPYDGEAYEYDFVIFENTLLAYAGEEFHGTLLFNGAAQAIDAGNYTITLGSWSVSSAGGNVSGNYEVHLTAGSLVIEQRTVTVNLGNLTKKYDGTAFEYTQSWSADGLLADVRLEANVVCTQNGVEVDAKEVGQYRFALKNIEITGDAASNYNVVVIGTLTVTP